MRKAAWFQCLSCQPTLRWGQYFFSTCWILICQFKFPARQPYARLFTCMSFRLVSKQRKTSNAVGMSCLIFWLQARELRLWVCFNTFRNFKRSLNKRRMSPAQTITSEWTEEKCLEKRQTNPQTQLGNRANRWLKMQVEARCQVAKVAYAATATMSIKRWHCQRYPKQNM